MSWQYFIDIIDTISPVVTLSFGIYGATNDTKPKDGKMTKQGKIALWGLIISGSITLLVKTGGLYTKIEKDKQAVIERQITQKRLDHERDSVLQDRDSTIRSQTLFQDSVSKSLKNSLNDLRTIRNESRVTLTSLNDVAVDQKTTLQNTRRGLNPLLPVTIGVSYEVNLAGGLEEFPSYKQDIYAYLDSLKYYEKEEVIDRRKQFERTHHYGRGNTDTNNLTIDLLHVPNESLLNTRFVEGRRVFASIFLQRQFSIKITTNPNAPSEQSKTIIDFKLDLYSVIEDLLHNEHGGGVGCRLNCNENRVYIEASSISPTTTLTGFASLYDLQKAEISIRTVDNTRDAKILTLTDITINTGYELKKQVRLKFTNSDKSKIPYTLYTRIIKPEEVQ